MNNNLTVFSEDVIPVYTTDTEEKVILGRELHEKLGIKTAYKDWFPRMVEYGKDKGFEEGQDFNSLKIERVQKEGNRNVSRKLTDHILSLRMAKHIATIQKTNIGFDIRERLFEIQEMMAEKRELPSYQIDDEIERAEAWLREARKRKALELECKAKDEKIALLEPKAKRCDLILQSNELLTVTKIAKEYGYSAIAFNRLLESFDIQYCQSGQWFLKAKYQNLGYTAPYDYHYSHSNGSCDTNQQTRWTQKGRLFLYNFLKERGIVPLIEREANAE